MQIAAAAAGVKVGEEVVMSESLTRCHPGCPGPVIHEEEFKWGFRGARLQTKGGARARQRALFGRLASMLPAFSLIAGASVLGRRAGGRYRVGVGSAVG